MHGHLEFNMIYEFHFNGLPVKTGDVICTANGKPDILPGEFWRLIGRLLPGEVDHIVIYLGPQGRCAESGSLGVITFEMPGMRWQSEMDNLPGSDQIIFPQEIWNGFAHLRA